MPTFINVTTNEMLRDRADDFYLIKEMPILIAKEIPIRNMEASHA